MKSLIERVRRHLRFGFVHKDSVTQVYLTVLRTRGGRVPPGQAKVAAVLADSSDDDGRIKLNIGGGKGHPRIEGWTIVDLRPSADLHHDITKKPLPYEAGTVDIIFTSHTLEHIPRHKLAFVLAEFRRILKPEVGLLRIGVPDIELAIEAYSRENFAFFKSSDVSVADRNAPIGGLLASWFYSTRLSKDAGEGHVHCFDFSYMKYLLEEQSFSKVWRSAFRTSILPELRGEEFDRHPNDSLFVEAMI